MDPGTARCLRKKKKKGKKLPVMRLRRTEGVPPVALKFKSVRRRSAQLAVALQAGAGDRASRLVGHTPLIFTNRRSFMYYILCFFNVLPFGGEGRFCATLEDVRCALRDDPAAVQRSSFLLNARPFEAIVTYKRLMCV